MENIIKLTLSNGMNVEIDTTKATGHTLMQARKSSQNGESVIVYVMAEISTFNGEKIPAPEILNFKIKDILVLEKVFNEAFTGE